MKNNIKEIIINKQVGILKNMNEYAIDFVCDYGASSSEYICDAFTEFADSKTSIYYKDIINYISNNVEAVNDAIAEVGWDGVGKDLYKAGQFAEFREIENQLNEELENIILYLAFEYIINCDFDITIEQIEKIENDIEFEIDHNNRLDDICDYINEIVNPKSNEE